LVQASNQFKINSY